MESTFSGAELQSTIHPSEAGVLGISSNPGEPMLALSLKSSFDSVKNAKVSGRMFITVRHMYSNSNSCDCDDDNKLFGFLVNKYKLQKQKGIPL